MTDLTSEMETPAYTIHIYKATWCPKNDEKLGILIRHLDLEYVQATAKNTDSDSVQFLFNLSLRRPAEDLELTLFEIW